MKALSIRRLLLTVAMLWSAAVFGSDGNVTDNIKHEVRCQTVRGQEIIAACNDGRIISVTPGHRPKTLVRKAPVGDIVSMTCYQDNVLLLNARGVIYFTTGFKSFSAFDFNSTYAGFYDYVDFTAICASPNSICLAGTYENGSPAVFESATGDVWSERELSYTKGGQTLMLLSQPTALEYDELQDRFVMRCADGSTFYMPGCSHCNSLDL